LAPFSRIALLSLAPKGRSSGAGVARMVASDASTRPLRSFRRGRGYAVSGWRQAAISDCARRAERDGRSRTGIERHPRRKVSIVGWSLGGLYARQLAKMMPDRVRS